MTNLLISQNIDARMYKIFQEETVSQAKTVKMAVTEVICRRRHRAQTFARSAHPVRRDHRGCPDRKVIFLRNYQEKENLDTYKVNQQLSSSSEFHQWQYSCNKYPPFGKVSR